MQHFQHAILLATSLYLCSTCYGQEDTSWTFEGQGQLNFSQAAFYNWAAGGENSVSFTGIADLSANYAKEKNSWENNLQLAYGQSRLGEEWRKSEDAISLSSKYGHNLSKVWLAAALLEFKTQFANGYNYPNDSVVVSKAFAPAYANISVGFDYKPADYFSLYLSPLGGKFTYVGDTMTVDQKIYGVPAGKKLRAEMGATAKLTFKKELLKNVTVSTDLLLFSNYLDSPQNVDVDWQTSISMKVNDFIAAFITSQLIYDHDILVPKTTEAGVPYQGVGTQFKEVLAIGLTYKL